MKKGFEGIVQRVTKNEVDLPVCDTARLNWLLFFFCNWLWLWLMACLHILRGAYVISAPQDYKFGDGTKVLVESAKEGLEKLGRTLGVVPDYESKVFSVPLGCRRFLLRPDTGELLI